MLLIDSLLLHLCLSDFVKMRLLSHEERLGFLPVRLLLMACNRVRLIQHVRPSLAAA
jgi:hypothetical protein